MTTFRVAVVDQDENGDQVIFQHGETVSAQEDAEAKVPAAQAEHEGLTVRIEQLDVERDEAGQALSAAWNEVSD